MFRRHPIFALLFGLLLLGMLALAVFIGTFDLDRYREQLQQTLAATFKRSVLLGEARLSFTPGPAFDFSHIAIGPDNTGNGELQADHLLLKLKWMDLLLGDITFSEIVLARPRLSLEIPSSPAGAETALSLPDLSGNRSDLAAIRVHTLTITDGSLLLIDRRRAEAPQTLAVTNLDIRLREQASAQAVVLHISGTQLQKGVATPFTLQGRITPICDLRHWQECDLDLSFELDHFQPGPFLALWSAAGSGQLSLRAELKGALRTGLSARMELRGYDLQLSLPQLWSQPRQVTQATVQGNITQSNSSWALNHLRLQWNELALRGGLILGSRNDVPWVEATLTDSVIPVRELRELLPLQQAFPPSQRLRTGVIRLESAKLDCPQAHLRNHRDLLNALRCQLKLEGIGIQLDQPNDIEQLAVTADWDRGTLALTDGQASYEQLPLIFSGSLESPWEPDFPLTLTLAGSLQSQSLLRLALRKPVDGLTLVGALPFSFTLNGTRQSLQARLKADLTQVDCHLRHWANKPAALPGRLEAAAEIGATQLTLHQGVLQLGPLLLTAQGTLSQQGKQAFALDLSLKDLDLRSSRPYLPLLEHLDARGSLELKYGLKGQKGTLSSGRGTATLKKVGVHLTRVIADLNDIEGEVQLYSDHAESRNLTLKMGSSPVTARASIASFQHPALDLQVKGKAVRSSDIIFHNPRMFLQTLDGHLIIDRQGIFYDPVQVRLKGGTIASVRGSTTHFDAPATNLDIEADYGNIDEVINLWQNPDAETEDDTTEPEQKGKSSLLITTRVRKGQLGHLRFENARGEISLRHGVLTIFPLEFSAGSGRCQGQVAVDRSVGSPPLLKISGHVEQFDASAIHSQLLQRKSLVSGTLKGDFYLEGLAGKRFLETSNGGCSFTIKNGVLRKFKTLSKVFSILNVSQILFFSLPDMDTEGMPFTRLTASAALDQGVLSTQDLFIDSTSMNLSLIGDLDLKTDTLDMILGVKPLRTVDQIVTNIPVAGWLLAGKEKALITAHFEIKGKSSDPEVTAIPISSVSDQVLGIFKRVLGLPGKVVSDVGEVFK